MRLPLHRAERGRTLRDGGCRPILWPDFHPRVSNLLPSVRAGPRTRPLQLLAVFRRGVHRCHADLRCRWSMGRPGGDQGMSFLWCQLQCVPPPPVASGGRDVLVSRGAANHHFSCAAPVCLLSSASIRRALVLRRQGTQEKIKLGRPRLVGVGPALALVLVVTGGGRTGTCFRSCCRFCRCRGRQSFSALSLSFVLCLVHGTHTIGRRNQLQAHR